MRIYIYIYVYIYIYNTYIYLYIYITYIHMNICMLFVRNRLLAPVIWWVFTIMRAVRYTNTQLQHLIL